METVKTATGKTFQSDYFATIPYPPQAYIRIDAPVVNVASVFSDPKETSELLYENVILSGYTRLLAIIPENGMVKICLGKEN